MAKDDLIVRILVTGAAGFIGSHLSEFLLKVKPNWEVIGLDNFDPFYDRRIKENNLRDLRTNPAFTFIEGDILDPAVMMRAFRKPITLVVHLAAKAGVRPSLEDPRGYQICNVEGTQSVLDAMIAYRTKYLVFGSSSSVYGNRSTGPFSENDPTDNPYSPYAATKRCGEILCQTFANLYDLRIISLRFFTVYGPRQRPDLGIHKFFKAIHLGQELNIYGDGSAMRDFTYFADIVQGIFSSINFCITNPKSFHHIINLGSDAPISVSNLIKTIEHVMDKSAKIVHTPAQLGDVEFTHADLSKARNLLDYQPNFKLKSGLYQFLDWIKMTYT